MPKEEKKKKKQDYYCTSLFQQRGKRNIKPASP